MVGGGPSEPTSVQAEGKERVAPGKLAGAGEVARQAPMNHSIAPPSPIGVGGKKDRTCLGNANERGALKVNRFAWGVILAAFAPAACRDRHGETGLAASFSPSVVPSTSAAETCPGGLWGDEDPPCGSGERRRRKSPRPLVQPGKVRVTGPLPVEVVQRIVRQNWGQFTKCYESMLERQPGIEGRMVVEFVIGLDGAVANHRIVNGTLGDTEMVNCVGNAFASLSFPDPERKVVSVVIPIEFRLPDAKASAPSAPASGASSLHAP
jgi:hypothetical protein